jgi:hypothetical protein
MTLESLLDNRYQIMGPWVALSEINQRYYVQGQNSRERFIASFSAYDSVITEATLEQQRKIMERMIRPPVALLCRVNDVQLDYSYQCVVSESPGDTSLHELLQQRGALNKDEAEAFLRILTEACEVAVEHGWPKLSLNTKALHLDSRLGLPRIPAPDIPSQDIEAQIPKDTRCYVHSLALLCAELLGQSTEMLQGNARYEPLRQLSSQQNVLLRRALASDLRMGFTSARAFMDEFFGVNIAESYIAQTERLRSLTIAMTKTEVRPILPEPATALWTTSEVIKTAPLSFRAQDLEMLAELKPLLRIQLLPDHEDTPLLALVADEWLTLGRSASDADFIAQFRPRSNMNDGRSRRISRVQCRLRQQDESIVIEEQDALNPSLFKGHALGDQTTLCLPTTFHLAGEYPVDIRAVVSSYDAPREFINAPLSDDVALNGAMIVRADTSGVLLTEAALITSDVSLHLSSSGRPWFCAHREPMAIGRLHRYAGQFWLEPLNISAVRAEERDEAFKEHQLVLLSKGLRFHIGHHLYGVQ